MVCLLCICFCALLHLHLFSPRTTLQTSSSQHRLVVSFRYILLFCAVCGIQELSECELTCKLQHQELWDAETSTRVQMVVRNNKWSHWQARHGAQRIHFPVRASPSPLATSRPSSQVWLELSARPSATILRDSDNVPCLHHRLNLQLEG
ncbi:hypothetical protein EDB84DRAFT_1525214 [Lactarius hengduanensis]|nr:hypothetical protein EDB84DRAFT_1525214 [Lactarius hengduanensis]